MNGNGKLQDGGTQTGSGDSGQKAIDQTPNKLRDVRSVLELTKDVFGDLERPEGLTREDSTSSSPYSQTRIDRPVSPSRASQKRRTYESAREQKLVSLLWLTGGIFALFLTGLVLVMWTGGRVWNSEGSGQVELVQLADSLMDTGDYVVARKHFTDALRNRPDDAYIQHRLVQLDRLIEAEHELTESPEQQYLQLVAQGDSLFGLLQNLRETDPLVEGQISWAARDAYVRALVYHPDNGEIKDKLIRLAQNDSLIANKASAVFKATASQAAHTQLRQQQLDRYKQAVEEGDRYLADGEYLEAQIQFRQALIYQPENTYAAEKLEIIDALWKEASLYERFDAYRKRGDQLLQARLFEQARTVFREALSIKPQDPAVRRRIAECDQLERESQQQLAQDRERTRQYQQILMDGDALIAAGKYQEALEHFEEGIKNYPGDPNIDERLTRITNTMANLTRVDEQGVYKYLIGDEKPVLIGSLADLYARISYPESAVSSGLEGQVYVEFIVDENGRVQKPRILQGLSPDCDREVLRAISKARFQPARVNGYPVKAYQTFPIKFKLSQTGK